VTVLSNLTVESGASISADGLGHGSALGPGKGGNAACGGGGGYGGLGGNGYGTGGNTYGSISEPVDAGSGGGTGLNGAGGSGGGVVQLTVNGWLQLDGRIGADGAAGNKDPNNYWGGGGSGGSIFLQVGTLAGSGVISANGGSTGSCAGGGSGGRIAIYYGTNSYSGTITACGGAGAGFGGGGTIYTKSLAESVGQVLVSNCGNSGSDTPFALQEPVDLTIASNTVVVASNGLTLANLQVLARIFHKLSSFSHLARVPEEKSG